MSTGLLAVAEAIGMIGAAAKMAAANLRDATDAAKENQSVGGSGASNTSSMGKSGDGGIGSMGASSGSSGEGGAVTGGSNQIATATALMAEMKRRFR
jgi:hypothetical protein